MCFDGVKRLCHIRGKLRKKVWINETMTSSSMMSTLTALVMTPAMISMEFDPSGQNEIYLVRLAARTGQCTIRCR